MSGSARFAAVSTFALLASGCTVAVRDFASPGPGTSKEEAIEVCRPAGQREYLARLSCPDGNPPISFARVGNVGPRSLPPPGSPEWEMSSKKPPHGVPTKEALDKWLDSNRRMQPGEVDLHIVDLYNVHCADGTYRIFLDMYHCADPATTLAPPGFSFSR